MRPWKLALATFLLGFSIMNLLTGLIGGNPPIVLIVIDIVFIPIGLALMYSYMRDI